MGIHSSTRRRARLGVLAEGGHGDSRPDNSALGRVGIWEVYIQSTFERPILGWGAGGQTGAYYGAEAQALAEKYSRFVS